MLGVVTEAPVGIVFIVRNESSVGIDEPNHIALGIGRTVVGCTIVFQHVRHTAGVIVEIWDGASIGLSQKHTVAVEVIMYHSIGLFFANLGAITYY